ncbi:MAG: DoxX family protein [Saprospiraceae bacterium]|nr:DoxX family protein [Saprospiraceae bacterium]
MNRTSKIVSWVVRIGAAVILLQTLFFKFTGHPDSVYIFSQLGVEPWGRIGLGIVELITAVLLLLPRTAWLGALLGLGIISGAIFAHLTQLGITIEYNGKNDGGALFSLAVATFVLCAITLYLHRSEIRIPFLHKQAV